MIERIALHEMIYYDTSALISTVKMFDMYETMVMFEDGDEIEAITNKSLEDAKKTHDRLVKKYNDKIYENSTAKILGAKNNGQFVKTIISC